MRSFVSIPDAAAELNLVAGDGGLALHLYRLQPANKNLPVVLFGHACGFAAGSYLPLLRRLTAIADVFAFDARGHGGSDGLTDDLTIYNPDTYARDLAAIGRSVAARTGDRPITYIGHSLGAATLLRLGALHQAAFAAVPWAGALLFEPPIFPTPDRPEHAECISKDAALVKRTSVRRASWESPEALAEALRGRGVFRRMPSEYLLAHARATLRPLGRGLGYELCCPPRVEARTFAAFADDATFRALPDFPPSIAMRLIGGDPHEADRGWVTLMAPVVAHRLGLNPDGQRRFLQWQRRGHLMIQEAPEMTYELVRDFLSTR